MNSKKLTQVFYCLLLCITMTGLASCRLGRATPTPIPISLPGQLSANANAAADLEAFTVQQGEVVQEELFTGRVTPAREADLFFRRSGQITEVYVEDGDQLQTGDIIAALDSDILELDLESALIGLAIAKENLTQAQKNLAYRQRQTELNLSIAQVFQDDANDSSTISGEGLTKPNLVQLRKLQTELAQLNLDNVDETVDPALELNVKRAELAVERVKQTILEGQIEAPFDGEIRFINLPEADEQLAVQAYGAVARLVDTGKYKIELNLARTQLELLSEGMAVEVSAASLGDRALPGVIDALPRPFGTSQGALTEVVMASAEDNNALREGITVAVTVRLKSKPNALVIPQVALQEENGIYHVTVREGELLRRVAVAVGVVGSDLVEIIAGLEEGQTVVVQ